MTTIVSTADDTSSDLTTKIRASLAHLNSLDTETDGYLSALAFILQRVAAADDGICEEEVSRMEEILVEHASLSPSEATLAVEMAKQRGRIADCCCAYEASRRMRPLLDGEGQVRLRSFLQSVAEADGCVSCSETHQIRQISTELRLS